MRYKGLTLGLHGNSAVATFERAEPDASRSAHVSTLITTPVLQLVVFGYAIDLDVDRIPTVVCDQDRTLQSRDLAETFFADRTFLRRADVLNPSAAQDDLEEGRAAVALIVPRAADAMRLAVT